MGKRFYNFSEVCEMFGVARPTIIRWAHPKTGCGFPQRVLLGRITESASRTRYGASFSRRSNCRVGFPVDEVEAFITARKENRPPPLEDDDNPDGD